MKKRSQTRTTRAAAPAHARRVPDLAAPAFPDLATPPQVPLVYSRMFDNGAAPPAQHCADWNVFRASVSAAATSITIKGSGDPAGVTCSGAQAGQIK